MADEWSNTCKEWLTDTEIIQAGALGCWDDNGVFSLYACSPDWDSVYKDNHEEDMLQDDGVTVKKVMIDEADTISNVLTQGYTPLGCWIAGEKYTFVRKDDECPSPNNEFKFKVIVCARPGKVVDFVITPNNQVVMSIFQDSDKQTSGKVMSAACAFAEFLATSGY
eukprot:GHVL01037778.1.p1 GENE.GHVL01037778.1~~GHVL01037778.1.p1  ORF type:complete len:166 (+),score=16.31 GHVL01037778.1:60-557(+)